MKRKLIPSVALAALAAAPLPALAQEDGGEGEARRARKASLAVLPFTYAREVLERDVDDVVRLSIEEFETSTFTNKFITALVKTRKFDVVERSRIDTLLDEMQLSESGITDPARAVEAGRTIGADYVLMGEISVFRVDVSWNAIPNTSRLNRKVEARIIADMRIVESRTSKIVAAEKGEVVHTGRSMHKRRVATPVEPEALDALQRDLCEQLTLEVIDAVYPVKIIGTSEGTVSLNRGEGGGLEVGQVLEVFVEGEELVDPDTGDSLGFQEVEIGRVRVTEILPRFSRARVVEADEPLAEGLICRKLEEPEEPEEPADAPRRGPDW